MGRQMPRKKFTTRWAINFDIHFWLLKFVFSNFQWCSIMVSYFTKNNYFYFSNWSTVGYYINFFSNCMKLWKNSVRWVRVRVLWCFNFIFRLHSLYIKTLVMADQMMSQLIFTDISNQLNNFLQDMVIWPLFYIWKIWSFYWPILKRIFRW